MTVAELIEKLRVMPQDIPVLIESSDGEYAPENINIVQMSKEVVYSDDGLERQDDVEVVVLTHQYSD